MVGGAGDVVVAARPSEDVEFLVLGPLAAVGPTGDVLSLGPPRRRALLAALLVHSGTVLPVDRLIDLLWGAYPPPTAATMVHGAVAGLRRVVEPGIGKQAPTLLQTRGGGYALEVRPEQVDAVRFERLVVAGRPLVETAPARASQMLADALALWRGPAFAGIEEPFARDAASRLEELRMECVEQRMEAELALNRHHDVVADLEALVVQYPLRERLCAQLMVGMYRSGRQADALAAYRALRRTLRAELGLDPGPDLRRLERAVLQHSDGLERGGPARVARPRSRLPVPISTFVGRVRERDDVAALLARHRLVTLTGPGGSGKTRLALEVARAMVGRTMAEAWLVDLAPVTTPAMVRDKVADTLGIRAEPGRDLADTLAAAVSARDVIILLDNCEQLVETCAELAQSLLTSTERVRLLATSRERLGVPGEAVYFVPPLATASPHDDWEQVAASDAVRLFADRAAAARPGFTVTAADAHLVLEVCRRLDGLPLALELAAARAATMPLRHLADRLDDRFRLLDSATRGDTPRHRSLAATVAWSYDLLNGPERTVFERVAVFPAAFALDAAEEVVAGDGLAARDIGMLLSRLVTVSAVQLDDSLEGEMRYRLLETTRQFARQRLDAVTLAGLRERHARRYLAQAQEAEPHLLSAESARWLPLLHSEQDNFRAALGWSFGPEGDPELGAQLVRCLWHPWDLRGARGQGLHWVHAGLDAIGADRPAQRLPLLSAGALLHLGQADFVAWARGAFAQAHRLYEDAVAGQQLATARAVALQALAHAREVGEDLACGLAVDVLASLEQRRDDVPAALRLAGGLCYSWTRLREVLRFHHEFMASAPDELSTAVSLALDPVGEPVVTVAVCYCGPHEEGQRVLRPLRAFGPPVADTIGIVPYLAWQSAPDAGWPSGQLHYWKAGWLRQLTDGAIETMEQFVPRMLSAASGVGLQRMGGAASRVAASATAFAQRAEQYDFLIASQWPDPRDSARNLQWTRAFFAAMQPHLESAAYVNNLGVESQERVRAAYGDNYPRLAALKRTYDPSNVFRLNQNIAPATPQAQGSMMS